MPYPSHSFIPEKLISIEGRYLFQCFYCPSLGNILNHRIPSVTMIFCFQFRALRRIKCAKEQRRKQKKRKKILPLVCVEGIAILSKVLSRNNLVCFLLTCEIKEENNMTVPHLKCLRVQGQWD